MSHQRLLPFAATHLSSLPHVDDLSPLDESDTSALEAVRKVLKDHRKLDRFGIFLLHRHFQIGEDEIVLEQTDVESRISTTRVVQKATVNLESMQTMWRFNNDSRSLGVICVARCVPEQGH